MSKPKITEAKCFEEVAKVIGPKNAERELFLVSQCKEVGFEPDKRLAYAFWWAESPQRWTFWKRVSKGINPYNK